MSYYIKKTLSSMMKIAEMFFLTIELKMSNMLKIQYFNQVIYIQVEIIVKWCI